MIMFKKFFLYFNTIKYIKLIQLFYRLKYTYFTYHPVVLQDVKVKNWSSKWTSPKWSLTNWDGNYTFTFLSHSKAIRSKNDWVDEKPSTLWVYNLHYLDVLTLDNRFSNITKKSLLLNWINSNSDCNTIGWDPYCLSLRLVNIIKWFSQNEINDQYILQSVAQQAHALLSKLEYHIQANHLFSNGKALVFVGAFIDGPFGSSCLKKGLKILDKEMPEQFCSDGGHYELSPMYHQILMSDICDLINLSQITGLKPLLIRAKYWVNILKKANDWRIAMYHSNDEIAFFNDCALGIAPPNDYIDRYLEHINCINSFLDKPYWDLQGTGFFAVFIQRHGKLIFDAGSVGPSFQPGHAHADSLSLELSLFNSKLFVNSGTSLYGTSKLRQLQRETISHNTVEVDGLSSSQVWGGFRVAKRADITHRSSEFFENTLLLCASHNGYVKQDIAGIHTRKVTIAFERNTIEIEDNIKRKPYSKAVSRFYLHPSVKIKKLGSSTATLLVNGNKVVLEVAGGILSVEDSLWFPHFGQQVVNKLLSIKFLENSIKTTLSWSQCLNIQNEKNYDCN